MSLITQKVPIYLLDVASALNERPAFAVGDSVRVVVRFPVGHYRVPIYLRGKTGIVESIIASPAVDNETEGFGQNAGSKLHYYRIAIPMTEIWHDYVGATTDSVRIEIYETWLVEDSK